ncbi:AraC family transcriptional regulator [Rhizobium sp. ERR 922]|uniref:AraC family transcriptional regulator n=1 Tax=Rhizobium dioscoreae TaxID=2653122 RepID=A0ABQ0Z6D0_9HYPH|nr:MULTISPECIES: helix-turn-helix transcriptional regulator [Rhizobium]MCZ3379178.1 helix-turn-helix transcriptional regulator [Rhizobium sp. AG207R]TWB13192.1 AraC family transcriptional regulator [Rhizobium sp. ERR1071]TWB53349.1 AraC family transcriptional regulator [Rhizobium sp. ERR 922]TWB95687.1 AraC family transcriptional regulator [Rhizobium sp. ERR 942]GES40897.1 AraC family transcriptional regulator [Rhizobium dioscoreae]
MQSDPTRKHLEFHNTHRAMAAMDVNYPDGASTGWHSHPRGQLLHAIEGVMIVRSAEGSWVVPPNRALWLAAGLEHDVKMSGEVKIRTVFIDATAIRHMPAESCVIEVSPLLRELIVAAVQVPLDYGEGSRDDRLMQLLLDEVRVSDVLPLHLPMPEDERIKRICEAMTAHPADTSTAGQWAERLNVTAKTVHRLFARETGMSFARWREQARLLSALSKLANGERIIDVAFDCGYASQSAFTAMFRRHFGKPPSEFYR